jgi:two-component sensor histidine kinase
MMRETHHRIKNNLGIVNALIHLRSQSRHTELGIQELSRQIRTIMVLHEKLHRQEQQVNSVGLARHLRDVLDIVFSTSEGTGIDYSVNIGEGVAVDPKSAVPLGLIINELAMNALKYSFPGAEERRFVVRGEREAPSGQYLLTVTHSGPPLPEEFSFEREDTVGLQLVSALIQQLDGSIELQRSPEPAFMFRIPLH